MVWRLMVVILFWFCTINFSRKHGVYILASHTVIQRKYCILCVHTLLSYLHFDIVAAFGVHVDSNDSQLQCIDIVLNENGLQRLIYPLP